MKTVLAAAGAVLHRAISYVAAAASASRRSGTPALTFRSASKPSTTHARLTQPSAFNIPAATQRPYAHPSNPVMDTTGTLPSDHMMEQCVDAAPRPRAF